MALIRLAEHPGINIEDWFNRIMDEFLLSLQASGSIFSGATK